MANKYERASQWVKKNEDKLSGNKAEAAAGKKTGSGKSGGYQSAKEWVSQRGSDVSGREAAANNVRNWLSRVNSAYSGMQQYEKDNGNRWDKNYGGQWYEQLLEAKRDYESIGPKAKTLGLDYSDVYADLKKMTRGIQQSREYMSQFDSEEAYQTAIRPSLWYQKYQGMDEKGLETAASQTQDKEEKAFIQSMAANARMERLRNLDETMTQTEIGRLKRQRDERMDAAAEDWTDAASREKARQAAKEEKQYNARIAQLETEITQARRAKQAQALGGVGDRTSEHYDPAFREGSQYRGDDIVSRIINETEQERAWRKQQDDTWGESVYSQRGYDRLSQQEKDTYNYWAGYDSRNGTQKAQEYLDSMQETLNARIAEDRYGDIADENRLMKLAFYTATGLEGAMQGIGKSLDFLTGKEEYTPASASAIAASMLLQDDRENGTKVWKVLQDEEGGRTWEEFLGQSAMSIGNMVPSMATAFALNALLPGLGLVGKLGSGLSKAGSLGVMGAGIAGNTYAEAINQGYSPENAKAYAMANAASEIGTELLFGGIEGMTGIGTEAMTDALLKKTDNAILRYLTRVGTDGLGEAMEEGVQAIIEPWMNSVTLHTDEALRGEDVAYNMLAGFSTGAIMSAPMIGAEEYGTYRAGKNALANGLNVDALQKVTGSFDADTEAARLSKKIGSSTGAYTIGRALREVDAGLSEQNVRDISGYLQSKNLPENVAEHNARLLNYVAMGGELSQRDVKVLEADKLLADAFREVVLKQDSTVNQRIQGARNLFGKTENISAQSRAKAGSAQTGASQKGDSVLTDPNRAVLAVDSREGDTMQLRLKDGRVVDSTEAGAYHDENEAVLFDTARRYSADTAGANRIVNGFAGSGLSLEEYSKGIADSYRYGQYGMNYSQVKEGSLSSQVDGDAAYDAYLAGMRWAATQYAKAQKAAMEARQPNQAAQLHFQRKGRTFDGKRESALAMMDTLSKALGEDFWVFESYEKNGKRVYADETGAEHAAPNGFYDKNGVHIDLNAGNDGRGVMLYTLGHELTHYIRQNSPEKFKAFADLIMESFGNRGVSADALIQEQIAKAARNGRNISYETAYEEMIADSMETILADGKALERLGQIQQKEPSLGQTIRQWAKDTAEKIRAVVNAYKGEKADSLEGRITAQLEQVLPELEELYAEGLADASGTGRAETREGAKKAAPEGGVKYQARSNGSLDEAEIEAIQKIGRRSLNSFTSADIRATEALARRYYQEMGEKSPFFRAWFGDWRANDNDTAVQIATQQADARGSVLNADTGWNVQISGKVFNETKNHTASYNVAAQKYLPYINDIVSKAVLLDSFGVDSKKAKSSNSLLMHSLYAVADIGNGPEVLKLFVEEMNNPNSSDTNKRAYQLQNIEKYRAAEKSSQKTASSISSAAGTIHTVADLFAYVKSQDSHFAPNPPSKVVNADGTPKVVYHGTNAEFTVFHSSNGTYWFSESMDYAEAMAEERGGNEMMEAFLDIKEPYYAKLSPGKFSDPNSEAQIIREAKAGGYDGVVIEADTTNELLKDTFYVVFSPNQIKSATQNIGTFDKGNPDIRFSLRDVEIERQYIDFNNKLARDAKEKETVASLIERGKVTVIPEGSIAENLLAINWNDGKEARKAIRNILKPFLGVTVEFTYNGENATAYLTKSGSNHTLAGANTLKKGAALSAYYSLVQNAEYSYSGYPDHSTVSLNTDWDYFVSVAEVDGSTVPLVFAIRSVDFETRSQIYSIATKRNPGSTHDRVNQKTDGALPNYGELPDSKAMVSHAEESVNTKLSDRDPEAVKRNQILERQNEDLKDTVQYLKELVRLQGKVTDGTVYSRNSVEWAGKQMMKEANAKGDIRELTGILEKTYRAMGEGSEDMTQLIDQAAGWLADHRKTEKPRLDSYAEGILKEMKGRSIALNASQKAEAEALLGSYADYRKRFFGSVNLSDKANTSLDQFWTEMSEIYPDIFRKDVSSADMPRELYQAVDTLRNLYEENGENPEEAEAAFLNEQRMKVWESFSTLKPIRTVADKNQAKVEAIKERYNAKLRDIQSRYESQRQELKAQRQADLQAVRERLQAKAESTQAAARERYRQQREDLNAARQDIQTMEQEFLRIAREYDKAGRAGNAAQEAAEEFQNALKAEIRKHKQDNAVWQAEFKRLSREYEAMGRNAQRLQNQLERNRAAAQARTESRKQTAVRNQIQDIHGKLRKMLLHPQKSVTGHAPTALTKAVAEVCDLFTANLEQAGLRRMGEYDSRIEALDGKLREKPELKYAQNGVEAANRQKERIAKTAEKLNALREAYARIQQDSQLGIYYDAHTASLLEAVTRELSGKDIYEMDSRELTQVKNAMASFYHAIVNANKIQLGAREAGLIETAAKWGQEISDVNSGFLSKYLGRYFHYQMSPDTFFAATSGFAKDNTGSEVQKMFQRGTERSLEVQREYYNLFSDITENKQYRKELRALLDNPTGGMVDVGLRNEKGESMKITRGMAMQLYMLLGQKDSFEALVYSGLKAPNMRMYYRDRSRAYGGQDIRQMYTTKLGDEAFRLSRELEAGEKALRKKDYGGMTESQLRSHLEEIRTQRDELVMGEEARLSQIRENIENLLTPMEKEAITLGRQWYRRSGQLMADAHEQTHGYRPGLVEDYVPIHRDGTTVWTDIRESDGAFNLENSGFLQERTENRNAVLLTDFFTELGSQRDAIARYYGYVQAQKDFNRLWKTRLPGVGRSINSMIAAKFGTGNTGLGISGVDYVENYIKDIGGGRDKSGGLFSLFYGASASATLSLNPRVAVSQLASIPTAAAVVGWKNMGVGFWKGLGTALSTEKMNDLAQKNVYFFQRYRGNGGITEIADMQTGSGMWQKIARSKGGKALLNWCQNMDVFATSTMYAMAEEAVKSRGMKSGDGGFEKAVNEMYTDIIRKTQPNYTITERSEMLRDSRAGAKIFSMYKTQPNQNLNILMQAAGTLSKVSRDFKAGVGGVTAADVRRAKTDFVNAGTAVVVGGNLMFVLVRTGVNLIMGQVAGYRDDETNEVTSDAVLEGMFKEFLSSMSGMFLLGGQAYDILNSTVSGESYYGLSDNAIKTVGDLTEKSVKLFQKIKEGGAEFGDYEKTAGALLTAMGVPYNNAKRFVEAYRHWAQNLEKGSLWNYSEEYTTGANYRNRFLEAYRAGDQEGCGNSLAALAALSDAPNQRRIASEVRSGFQSSFREKFLQGEITADEVKDIFANYLDAEPEDTERMIAGWKGQLETGFTLDAYQDRYLKGEIGTEDYIRYLTEYQGKERQEAEKAELRLRCERDTGYAYDELKETYLDGDITASQAERWMAEYGQEGEPQKKRKEYDFEKETGYAWADRRDAFLSGGVSGEQLKKWLADIEGRRDYDADNYLRDLEFERDNGFAYNQKLEQYVAGKISREQLKKVLTTRGNMYDAEADREIVAYDYIKNHPDTKLGLSTAYSYTRKIDKWDYTIETSGITEEQFLSFRDQKAACNGTDNDGDGRRDSGSVQAQILPIIDAMPITEEQKDTLWYFCGWSSRTLKRKAPWKK